MPYCRLEDYQTRFLAGCLCVIVLLVGACRGPIDSVQMILERHQHALARLPEEERAKLMPVGSAVVTRQAEQLLPTDTISLEQARTIAIRANPDIHAAQARLETASARIALARSRYLPTVQFSHTSRRTFHTPASRNRLNAATPPSTGLTPLIDLNNLTLTSLIDALRRPLFGNIDLKGDSNSYSEHTTAFSATYTIFDGLIREAQLMSAKYVYRASTMALVDVERLLIRAVDRAYYQVQLSEEQLMIAKADEEFSQEQFLETEKLKNAGRATQADVANFRVRVLAAQANVTAAIGLRETGRVVLAELMGLSDVTLPDTLKLASLSEETEDELTVPDPAPWISRALADRPDVLQIASLLKSDEEQVQAAKGLYSPTVAVSTSWGFDNPSNLRYTNQDQSSAAAMEFRWELYNGGARESQVREAESRRAETAAQLNRLRLSVQSDVRQAVIDLRNAQEQIRLQRESIKTAEENRRIVQAGYVAGRENLTRLNEAQRDFIQASADLARARIRLRIAWSDLHASAATYRNAPAIGETPTEGMVPLTE